MDHPFQVGQVYQNRTGAYETLRLDEKREKMLVRYLASGEEAELSIPVQARIWEIMGWEEQEQVRQQAVEEARYQHGYGEDFTGLRETDFKRNTESTTWRSRRGLAGQVSRLLSQASMDPSYTFVSWAIYRWPVAFLTHREDYNMAAFEMGVRKAKFMIELDGQNAYYGFYIERGDASMNRDDTWDWTRLWKALQERSSLLETIAAIETSHAVRFLGRGGRAGESYHLSDSLEKGGSALWDDREPWRLTVAERIRRLAEADADDWVEIYLVGVTPKAEAISAGVQVAHQIANTMKGMLPIYTAAVRG